MTEAAAGSRCSPRARPTRPGCSARCCRDSGYLLHQLGERHLESAQGGVDLARTPGEHLARALVPGGEPLRRGELPVDALDEFPERLRVLDPVPGAARRHGSRERLIRGIDEALAAGI